MLGVNWLANNELHRSRQSGRLGHHNVGPADSMNSTDSAKQLMIEHASKAVIVVGVATCVAIAVYSGISDIHSLDDFRNFREMRSVPDPIVVALADGSLPVGATTKQMQAIDAPSWTEDYGRCKIYGFTPERSYDHQAVMTVDDRVVSAHVGSCTWGWSFFDQMPDDIAESVGAVRFLRDTIDRMPEHAAILQPLLDDQLASLGYKPTNAKSEPSNAPKYSKTSVGDGGSSARTR